MRVSNKNMKKDLEQKTRVSINETKFRETVLKAETAYYDVKGNIIAAENYFQSDTMTMTAQLPKEGRFTIYAYVGDVFVWLCGGYLFVVMITDIKNRKSELTG